jgi:Lrp/AsnC family leucine-responsive transcriptional regulator
MWRYMPTNTRSNGRVPYKSANGLLDEVNRRLLDELQADPRISMSALARRVDMSAPAVSERVQKLEQAGVIAGYRLELSAAALGMPVTVLVRVRTLTGQLNRFATFVGTVPQVVECYRTTGDDCFVVKVVLPTVEDLEDVLDRFMVYGTTTTSVVLSSPVRPRSAPLPEG